MICNIIYKVSDTTAAPKSIFPWAAVVCTIIYKCRKTLQTVKSSLYVQR